MKRIQFLSLVLCSSIVTASGCDEEDAIDVSDETLSLEEFAEIENVPPRVAVSDSEADDAGPDLDNSLDAEMVVPMDPELGLCGGYYPGAHCYVSCNYIWHDLGPNVAYGHCAEVGEAWCYYRAEFYTGSCWT